MAAVSEDLLRDVAELIVKAVMPEKIVLFGSRARGVAQESSDIDLLVIEKAPFGPNRERLAETRRIRSALRPIHLPKDILVFSESEVDYWRDSPAHILTRALQEGKVLYER